MEKIFIEYDNEGVILCNTQCDDEFYQFLLSTGKRFIESSVECTYETHYVDVKNKKLKQRPQQPTQLNNLTLTQVPYPCTIYINETPYECDSDTIELEFDQPTTYTIRVEAWPYQDWETTYEN